MIFPVEERLHILHRRQQLLVNRLTTYVYFRHKCVLPVKQLLFNKKNNFRINNFFGTHEINNHDQNQSVNSTSRVPVSLRLLAAH